MEPTVRVKQGVLRGKKCAGFRGQQYFSFEGVPYAQTPLGKLRFKAPQPPTPWIGIKDATTPATSCYARCMLTNKLGGSEDCLYLNIYTPQLPQNGEYQSKPVLVYISGGAFTHSSPTYSPDFILTEDMVVVTFHYRVGLLGFLSFADTNLGISGNAGLKDQVMVLKWVRENASCFCGDPNNVTVYGDSAGGSSAHFLMLSPMGKGLFHRVIAMSGAAFNMHLADSQLTSQLIIKVLNLTTNEESKVLEILQSMTAKELVELQQKFLPIYSNVNTVPQRGVVIEKVAPNQSAFLCDHPETIMRSGKFNHVPFMVGFASNEGLFWTIVDKILYGKLKMPICSVPSYLKLQSGTARFEEVERKVQQFYFGNTFSDYGFIKLQGDNYITRCVNRAVRLHTMVSSCPVYYFRLSLDTSLNFYKSYFKVTYPGTCHMDMLGYLFKTHLTPNIRPNSTEEICMLRCVKLIANFARNGDPNSTDLDSLINIRWEPTERNKLNFLDIGDNITVGINPEKERMKFWDEISAYSEVNSKL